MFVINSDRDGAQYDVASLGGFVRATKDVREHKSRISHTLKSGPGMTVGHGRCTKECVSFPFTIGPMEIMPLSKPYDHNGLWDVKSHSDPEKCYRKDSNQIVWIFFPNPVRPHYYDLPNRFFMF